MMTEEFTYLKKFIGQNDLQGFYFIAVQPEEIEEAEKKLGFSFPSQIRNFYRKIGHGILSGPDHDGNDVLPPVVAAEFYEALKDKKLSDDDLPLSAGSEEYWMSEMAYDVIDSGDLPFFEVMDSNTFMVLKPHSDNPNAVWSDTGVKIEDSFEKFIWRLYYESPTFYDEIIETHYKALKENS